MNIAPAILLLSIGFLLVGCGEPVADVAKPQSYEKGGLKFRYPGNWKIAEDEDLGAGVRHLSVETGGDALVVVQLFPMESAHSLEDYARAFSTETAAALPIGKMTGSKFTPLAEADGFARLQENCTLQLLGEKIPHVRHYLSRDFGELRCFLICQVADEDLQKVTDGFKQVAASLSVALPAAGTAP